MNLIVFVYQTEIFRMSVIFNLIVILQQGSEVQHSFGDWRT